MEAILNGTVTMYVSVKKCPIVEMEDIYINAIEKALSNIYANVEDISTYKPVDGQIKIEADILIKADVSVDASDCKYHVPLSLDGKEYDASTFDYCPRFDYSGSDILQDIVDSIQNELPDIVAVTSLTLKHISGWYYSPDMSFDVDDDISETFFSSVTKKKRLLNSLFFFILNRQHQHLLFCRLYHHHLCQRMYHICRQFRHYPNQCN